MTHNHTKITGALVWDAKQGKMVIFDTNYIVPGCPACAAPEEKEAK